MSERRSDEILGDIGQIRSDLDRTIDDLAARFSPGELLDEAWNFVRRQGGSVASSLGEHPVPLALMGLGVAWLAVESATGGRSAGEEEPWDQRLIRDEDASAAPEADGDPGGYYRPEGFDEASGDEGGRFSELRGRAGDLKDRASAGASDLRERASQLGERVGGKAAHLRERGGRRASELSQRAGERASEVGRRASALLQDSPLAVAAMAFGLGMGLGLAPPSTDLEDALVGDTADRVKEEAASVAREVAESAKRVAADAAGAAREEVERQDLGGQVVDSAKRVVETARERAREEGLTREGAEERAREAAERIQHKDTH